MTIYKNTKDNKHSEAWQKNLKWLSHSLGKDEQTNFTQLLETTIKKAQEKQETQTQLNKLESEKKKLNVPTANDHDFRFPIVPGSNGTPKRSRIHQALGNAATAVAATSSHST